jgi:hypothetical protein
MKLKTPSLQRCSESLLDPRRAVNRWRITNWWSVHAVLSGNCPVTGNPNHPTARSPGGGGAPGAFASSRRSLLLQAKRRSCASTTTATGGHVTVTVVGGHVASPVAGVSTANVVGGAWPLATGGPCGRLRATICTERFHKVSASACMLARLRPRSWVSAC